VPCGAMVTSEAGGFWLSQHEQCDGDEHGHFARSRRSMRACTLRRLLQAGVLIVPAAKLTTGAMEAHSMAFVARVPNRVHGRAMPAGAFRWNFAVQDAAAEGGALCCRRSGQPLCRWVGGLQNRHRRYRAHGELRAMVKDAPPLPRLSRDPERRTPRTERDLANDVVFGVVAVELLAGHDRLDEEVANAFSRSVYDPVLSRLRIYSDSTTSEAREKAKSWRLQDRVLERQFSLGGPFTELAAAALNMTCPGGRFLPLAQVAARDGLWERRVEATDDPVSNVLIAWVAYQVAVGNKKPITSICRGRPFGYGDKPPVSKWLLPVFVEHDRSPHAERMALLGLGDAIEEAGGDLHPDSPIKGTACIYASHTPCISCLAVFCQLRRRLPGVRLWVFFDAWKDTRRWIGAGHDGSRRADDGSD